MPLFSPNPHTEFDAAARRLAQFCAWFASHPSAPPTDRLTARLRRPLPLGLGRALGLSRVAHGPVPNVRGWRVQWRETTAGGAWKELCYLVTPSGRTYLVRPKRRLSRSRAVALFSDRSGFPPQPNPVSAEHAARIEQCLLSRLGDQADAGEVGRVS
jgi:hypothetical protein